MKTSSSKLIVVMLVLAAVGASLSAGGIPERALVLYGSVTNAAGPLRLASDG
jgi:hypothetical protein